MGEGGAELSYCSVSVPLSLLSDVHSSPVWLSSVCHCVCCTVMALRVMSGRSRLTYANGDEYSGEFCRGRKHGPAGNKFVWAASCAIYLGEFSRTEESSSDSLAPADGTACISGSLWVCASV